VAAAAVACLGIALGLGGCGGHRRHSRASSPTLSIYTSLPFDGLYAPDAQAVYDAEKLALAQTGGVVNGYRVVLRPLNDAAPDTGPDPVLVADRARLAAADGDTIAYLGELTPGASRGSIPILGQAGILQVSPGDTASGLAGRTFARVVPPDSEEAAAQLSLMRKLGVRRLYLLADRTTYGHDIATATLSDAASEGVTLVDPRARYLGGNPRALVGAIKQSKADALLYAGSPDPAVATLWNELAAADPAIKKFASAAVTDSPSWAQTTASARYDTYLSAPGLQEPRLLRAAGQFASDFVAAYGRGTPWVSGIFGYVAMSGVLEALHSLGPHVSDPRAKMVSAFLHLRNVPSALGTYSILDGETTFKDYFFTKYSRSGVAAPYLLGA
jgi:branched-chain amino acid transport system substrate-binding protein